jgi:hypothetical protein
MDPKSLLEKTQRHMEFETRPVPGSGRLPTINWDPRIIFLNDFVRLRPQSRGCEDCGQPVRGRTVTYQCLGLSWMKRCDVCGDRTSVRDPLVE